MTLYSETQNLIRKAIEVYTIKPGNIFTDFKREQRLSAEYNGRQILELLQNCDDAGGKKVRITFDPPSRTLTISNSGRPFEAGGINSLMNPDDSPKPKYSYIGNKGLGFRSILSWAESIKIRSNGCIISFSKENTAKQFKDLPIAPETIAKELEKRDFRPDAVPMAMLAIPRIELDQEPHAVWDTSIEIRYKEEIQPSITSQLDELSEIQLLFLNNLEELEITGPESTPKQFNRNDNKQDSKRQVTINNHSWQIEQFDDFLPETYQNTDKTTRDRYNVRVAYKKDLSDEPTRLFSYFPTSIHIKLPCILHGSFELDGSRNQLVVCPQNDFIMGELVRLLLQAAEKLKTSPSTWDSYRLLSPLSQESDSNQVKAFYKSLIEARDLQAVFPVQDGSYQLCEQVKFCGAAFAQFISDHYHPNFAMLLNPVPENISPPGELKSYPTNELLEKLETYAPTLDSIPLRAELIKVITKSMTIKGSAYPAGLLIDQSGNAIPQDATVFTPPQSGEMSIPHFIPARFISTELFEELTRIMSTTAHPLSSRELRYQLEKFINLTEYAFNEVNEKIVSGTELEAGRRQGEEKVAVIRQMVQALWINYLAPAYRNFTTLPKAPKLYNRDKNLRAANELYLNSSYLEGELTEDVFGSSITSSQFIANEDFWQLHGIDQDNHRSLTGPFFHWLGVNQLTTLKPYTEKRGTKGPYLSFLCQHEQDISGTAYTIEGKMPDHYELLKRGMSREQLVLWLHKSTQLNQALQQEKGQSHEYQRPNAGLIRKIQPKTGVLAFHLANLHQTFDYVLSPEELPVLNPKPVNYQDPLFVKYGLSKTEVNAAMIRIGAHETFNTLSQAQMYDRVKRMPSLDENGTYTTQVYRLALKWMDENELRPTAPHLNLYSKKEGQGSYLHSPVYYSDNQTLPKRLTESIAMLNLPKRSGEDKVSKLFNVRTFKDITPEITEVKAAHDQLSHSFNTYFEALKPYLLAHRIDGLVASKPDIARQLRDCRIELVSSCTYLFNNRAMEMQTSELINTSEKFFIRVSEDALTAEDLRKTPDFCDSFAEVLCILFKVNDYKNTFRSLFINGLQDAIHLCREDLRDNIMQEVLELLNLRDQLTTDWQSIFQIAELDFPEVIIPFQTLADMVREHFSIMLHASAANSQEYQSCRYALLEEWLSNTGISAENFFRQNKETEGYLPMHYLKVKESIKDLRTAFQNSLYLHLAEGPLQAQMGFVSTCYHYAEKLLNQLPQLLAPFKFQYHIDSVALITGAIISIYDIQLAETNVAIQVVGEYAALQKRYQLEDSQLNEQLRSLLFFPGHLELLEQEFQKLSHPEAAPKAEEPVIAGQLNLVQASATMAFNPPARSYGNKPWIAGSGRGANNYQSGKVSEEKVYIKLLEEYNEPNVRWVSGYSSTPDKSDNLHYDLEYKHPLEGWKYAEVKTLSHSGFIITVEEVNFGKQYPDTYELFLVSGNEIYQIKDFFQFSEQESFESNSRYATRAGNYQVGLKISPQVQTLEIGTVMEETIA
ncbi:MAG: DUF3883 domain-containing protein [Bacteroidota bacterium]